MLDERRSVVGDVHTHPYDAVVQRGDSDCYRARLVSPD
jgi:hypothetical protein